MLLRALFAPAFCALLLHGQDTPAAPYWPPAGAWERRDPKAAGFDPERLQAAIAFAEQHPTDWPKDFSTQEAMFGKLLGPIPKDRAGTNGVIVRHGYLVATFGEVERRDPVYSIAKSMLSTVAAIAVRERAIPDLDEPVGKRVHDGGYDGEHNAQVTWRHHLQQESEWQGTMWGKNGDFVGKEEFGSGARKPRELGLSGSHYEYNDVRINRFALSLLRVLGKPVPEVFAAEVMQPIGSSAEWRWIPYDNAFVEIDGKRMPSVSGGTRWGGGMWISSLDLARFGLLWARGGKWGERQLLPPAYVQAALQPSAHGPDYGYLWWLNSKQQNWPGLPANCYGARGAGSNTVFVSPDHDLVIVWRWHATADHADAKFFAMVAAALQPAGRG
jgi:CubicO group peptidase (beta-lactamase class C family)